MIVFVPRCGRNWGSKMLSWLKLSRRRESAALFPPDTSLHDLHYAVFDTELTSLDARSNRLLSVGAVSMRGTRILLGEQFYRVVNPGVAVPSAGVLIHKLRPSDVEQGETPEQVLSELQAYMTGKILVGHFVGVDMNILRKELGSSRHELTNPSIDTAKVHRWLLRNGPYREDLERQLNDVSLAALARAYGLDFREAHHALDDAFVTARLWQKMISRLEEMKIRDLRALLRVAAVKG